MATLRARPTSYRGIQMRSRLEARAAAELDEHKLLWDYESRCFADATGQYLPDFEITANERWVFRHKVFIDVKPQTLTADAAAGLLRRMKIIWASDKTAELLVWLPETETVWRVCPHRPGPQELCAGCYLLGMTTWGDG